MLGSTLNGALDNLEVTVAEGGMEPPESVGSVTTMLKLTSAITQGAVSAAL